MKKLHLLLISSTLFLAACHKKEVLPAEVNTDPVFYLKGTLNGSTFDVYAGDEGYYMNTSVYQNSDNIYVFQGDLNSDCSSSCGYSLSILINDSKVSLPGEPIDAENALKPGIYNFLSRNDYPSTQVVSLTPKDAFVPASTYKWEIFDSVGTVATANTYSYSVALKIGRKYTVKYSYEDASGICMGSHTSIIKPGNRFKTWMLSQKNGSDVSFSAATDIAGEYTYVWDFGDGMSAAGKDVQHTYKTPGKYNVKLVTTDKFNNQSECYYEINTNGSGCENNFTIKYAALDYSKVLKTITVILKSPDGKVYSSADAALVGSKTAEIVGTEEYLINAMGNPTKRLHLRVSCSLNSPDGEIKLENADAFIGVAY